MDAYPAGPGLGGAPDADSAAPLELRAPAGARRWLTLATWLFGIAAVAAVALVVNHLGDGQDLQRALSEVHWGWIVACLVLQLGTYAAEGTVWWLVLHDRTPGLRWRSFPVLALTRLFVSQAIPSGGASGTVFVAGLLHRRGVPGAAISRTVLFDLTAYYSAYVVVIGATLLRLALEPDFDARLMLPAQLFMLVLTAFIAVLIAGGARPHRFAQWMRWTHRFGLIRRLAARVRVGQAISRRDLPLLARCVVIEVGIFLLDAATLWLALHAMGVPDAAGPALCAYVAACLVRTVGLLPGGLGTFEAACTGMLHLLGIPLGTALTATLIYRALSFWLPLPFGLLTARAQLRQARAHAAPSH